MQINETELEVLTAWLREHALISAARSIARAEKPGEGNMNKVLRVILDDGSTLIVKQARPWVEKFPDIPAPAERADIEAQYYRETAAIPAIATLSPTVLLHDPKSHIIVTQDLGQASDLSRLYDRDELVSAATLTMLADYLGTLHKHFSRGRCRFYIHNHAMRALNAEHIFRFPLRSDTGLNLDDITPGLTRVAAPIRSDKALATAAEALEQRYLADGDTLVHGDFYPGSILETSAGIRVIDPEFCFFGDAEFDLGVFTAHLMLANQPPEAVKRLHDRYRSHIQIDEALCRYYTAIEIVRRLLGLAQLPLTIDLQQKSALLEQSRAWLLA